MSKLLDQRSLCQVVPLKYLLAQAFRLAEDAQSKHARVIARNLGGDPDLIIQAGYRVVSGAFLAAFRRQGFELPDFVKTRKTIVLPCLNEQGEITGLHDEQGRWIVGPAHHVANPKRAGWKPIRICQTTSEADSLALAENVCVVVAHGLPILELLEQLSGEKARVAA